MSTHLTPLAVCERLIAPLKDLGRALGCAHPKAAYRWRRESAWRAAGDMPPHVNRRALEVARAEGRPLVARHLICGAEERELAALERALASGVDPAELRRLVAEDPSALIAAYMDEPLLAAEAAE